jgi:membrane protein DedA with SNARE-associated domain
MSKRTGYLIWIIVGVLATAGAAFSLIDASRQHDDFRLFRRILILIVVVVMTVRYIIKYLKEGRRVANQEVGNDREHRV